MPMGSKALRMVLKAARRWVTGLSGWVSAGSPQAVSNRGSAARHRRERREGAGMGLRKAAGKMRIMPGMALPGVFVKHLTPARTRDCLG